MSRLTRRGALRSGVAGIGAAGLAGACETTGSSYSGNVTFEHGVASGDLLCDVRPWASMVLPEDREATLAHIASPDISLRAGTGHSRAERGAASQPLNVSEGWLAKLS